MSNSQPKHKSAGGGCLKVLAWGCGTLVLLTLIPIMGFSGVNGIVGLIFTGLVVTLLIVASRRNAAKQAAQDSALMRGNMGGPSSASKPGLSSELGNASMPVGTSRYFASPPLPTDTNSAGSDMILSPICFHAFSPSELAQKKTVTCICGRKYQTADLLEHQRLLSVISQASVELEVVRQRLDSSSKPATLAAVDTQPATPARAPRVKAPRAKVSLSLQQWLIIGASVLVLIAGSVFVSTNIKTMPQWQFQLITILVAAATAIGSFRARKISVLLSNFLAAFSFSMQLATTSIIGDQLSPNFIWSNAPAWWWVVELTVLSAVATALAKFSKNFGWKGLALLSASAAAVILDLGLLYNQIGNTSFGLHLAVLSVTSVAVLAQNKYLRAIPQPAVIDDSFAEYVKDLANREDTMLRNLGQVSAGLQAVIGLGVTVLGIASSITVPFEVLPLVLLAAVWVGLKFTARFWQDQLTKSGVAGNLVPQIASGVVFVAASLALTSFATGFGSLSQTGWLSALASVAVLAALIAVAPLSGAFTPSTNVVTAGLIASAVTWLDWNTNNSGFHPQIGTVGLFAVLFGLLLWFTDFRLRIERFQLAAQAVNSVGLLLLAIQLRTQSEPGFGSAAFSGLAVLLVLGANLQIAIQSFVTGKTQTKYSPLGNWISFTGAALIVLATVTPANLAGAEQSLDAQRSLAFAFMLFSIACQCLAHWSPLKKSYSTHLLANNYLAQSVTILGVLFGLYRVNQEGVALDALLFGSLAALNYVFGTLNRSIVKMQLGYSGAILSFLVFQVSQTGFATQAGGSNVFLGEFATQLLVTAALTWLHTWFLRKRTQCADGVLVTTPVVAIGVSLVAGAAVLGRSIYLTNSANLLGALLVLGAAAIASSLLARFGALAKVASRASALGWVGIEYAVAGVLGNFIFVSDATLASIQWRWVVSTVILAAAVYLKNQKSPGQSLVVTFYLSNLATAWVLGAATASLLHAYGSLEPYSIWLAVALSGSTLLVGKNLGRLRTLLLLDLPVLGAAGASALYTLSPGLVDNGQIWRGILAFAVISAYSYLRSRTASIAWIVAGYLAGAGSACWLAIGVMRWFAQGFTGPEIFSVLIAASVVLGNWVLGKRTNAPLAALRYGILAAVLALPSVVYSCISGWDQLQNQWRLLLGLGVAAALSFWRLSKSKSLPWIAASYLSAIGSALAVGLLLSKNLVPTFTGPELYSGLAVVAILATHRVALKYLKLSTTWFSWGLPVSVALIPSTLFTYTSVDLSFAQLGADQVARVFMALAASMALMIWGILRGNLANASMGIAGLALLAIPNTAMHSNDLIPNSRVESTSLVIGGLLYLTLWQLGKYRKVAGNSLLFVGAPVVIALAPALVMSLLALGNRTLTTVDWWRFGIVLAASMTLLIVGTLREVAGMFYPGLVSVLLSALPYGFRQTSQNQWFLWVLLLLVAGVMVWLAVHLEKMKKAGRTSAVWLKELK